MSDNKTRGLLAKVLEFLHRQKDADAVDEGELAAILDTTEPEPAVTRAEFAALSDSINSLAKTVTDGLVAIQSDRAARM